LPAVNLARIVEDHPDEAVALINRGASTTYGELRSPVDAVRGGLAELGLSPGDRVGIAAANNPYFVVAYLAVLGRGCVAVPLNPTSPPRELAHQLATVGARALIVGPAALDPARGIDRRAVPDLEHIVAPPGAELDGATPLEALLASSPVPVADRSPGDVAVLIFTAGTAGAPKAAMLTHGNLRANIDQVQSVPERQIRSDDVFFGVLPLFHIFGLNVVLGIGLAAGAGILLVERFDPTSALTSIKEHKVTVLAGAPPMWTAWATLPDLPADAFAGVRLATSGASRLPEETAAAMERRFGLVVSEGYGLTEAAPVVTTSVGGHKAGSIGRPVPGVEVRVVEDGEDALLGDAGEIWVRGPNVFTGYWGDAEATATALTPDGWLRTGDVAVADDDGYLWIVDRSKDLIIVSGFNVYPAEVEEALLEHPGIAAVAVIGVDSPSTGEAVKAYVVPAPGHALEEDEVADFCATRLARYKCPTKVMFVDELPQGLGGKVLRRQLR
jgi:long-chain acyl-CoA synthetase